MANQKREIKAQRAASAVGLTLNLGPRPLERERPIRRGKNAGEKYPRVLSLFR
jgi:hypothetical protein